jgi:hypothetical protein
MHFLRCISQQSQYGMPFPCAEELPACCLACSYLLYEEFTVCFCDAPFY